MKWNFRGSEKWSASAPLKDSKSIEWKGRRIYFSFYSLSIFLLFSIIAYRNLNPTENFDFQSKIREYKMPNCDELYRTIKTNA